MIEFTMLYVMPALVGCMFIGIVCALEILSNDHS